MGRLRNNAICVYKLFFIKGTICSGITMQLNVTFNEKETERLKEIQKTLSAKVQNEGVNIDISLQEIVRMAVRNFKVK